MSLHLYFVFVSVCLCLFVCLLCQCLFVVNIPLCFIDKSSRPFLINSFRSTQRWVVRGSFCTPSTTHLKGLCQLESMRSEVIQITFNCQNSIVFNATFFMCTLTLCKLLSTVKILLFLMHDFLHVLCHVHGSEFREVNKRNGFR